MHLRALSEDLKRLRKALDDVENTLAQMRETHDALASHIFVSRRNYANTQGSKDGKREERAARLSYRRATELGYLCRFDCWHELMRALPRKRK